VFERVNLPHANKEIPYNYSDEKDYQFISLLSQNLYISRQLGWKKVYAGL